MHPRPPADTKPFETITVEPLTANIGAVVHGVDASRPLPAAQRRELQRAVLEHLVVFLRGQELTDDQQLDFAAHFGPLNAGSIDPRPKDRSQMLLHLEDSADSPPKADRWHTDVPFVRQPPNYAFLAMRQVPPLGGDTLWCSLYAAYEALSSAMREIVNGLLVDLGLGASAATIKELYGEAYYDEVVLPFTSVQHPLVRVHPESHRKALFLCGSFMNRIVGLHPDESAALVGLLERKLDDPNGQVRWKWQLHDLAIWDERCTNHRAMSDHFPAPRAVRRCLVGAGVPVGVGGLVGVNG